MKFPTSFSYNKGGSPNLPTGSPAGTPVAPTGAPGVANAVAPVGTVLFTQLVSKNGWPVYRIAVAYKAVSGTLALPAAVFVFEDATQTWYQVGAAGTVTPGQISFFDCVALHDPPVNASNLDGVQSGSMAIALSVCDTAGGGAPAGLHTFAMGADLTGKGI